MSESIKGLVSICIPVYNHEITLRETLLSAIHQSYENIEIVIVDDCSSDNSMKVISQFHDPRMRVYRNEHNLGMVGNWNKTLSLARGEFVLMLHGDDRLYVTSIEKKVDLMNADKDVMLAFSASMVINEDSVILLERHPFKTKRVIDGKWLALKSYRSRNIYGEPGNVMFRAEVARQLGGFADNTIYATDWDLWLRCSCLGKVAYSNEVLMEYRITQTNVTSKTLAKEMLADDCVLTSNIQKYGLLEISFWDIIVHRVVIIARTLMRNLYIMFRIHV